jgi:hypothetical protein
MCAEPDLLDRTSARSNRAKSRSLAGCTPSAAHQRRSVRAATPNGATLHKASIEWTSDGASQNALRSSAILAARRETGGARSVA